MADLQDLKELTGEAAAVAAEVTEERTPVVDDLGRSYATGKRKDAVARVWVKPGSGKVTVNGRDQETYFARPTLRLIVNQPFQVAGPKTNMMLSLPLKAAVFPAKLARLSTAFPKRFSWLSLSCVPPLRLQASSRATAVLLNVRNTVKQKLAVPSSSPSVKRPELLARVSVSSISIEYHKILFRVQKAAPRGGLFCCSCTPP